MTSEGLRRVDCELEIDRFLKLQISMRIVLKALFSKAERYLIRNNKSFVITQDESDNTGSFDFKS